MVTSIGRFALTEEVLDLARAQRGVDGDEDGAGLGERKLQDDPLRNIRGPHRHAIAAPDAGGDQPAGDHARFLFQRAKRPSQGAIGVNEGFVVGQ